MNNISLLDYFAGLAMQKFIDVQFEDGEALVLDEKVARWSYMMAKAMLKERKDHSSFISDISEDKS